MPLLLALLLLQDRGAAWTRHTIDASSRGADGVRLADADGDGHLDIVTGWEEGGEVRLALNPGPAKARAPWPSVRVGLAGSPEDALLVDLDGDGALDVVSCSEGETRAMHVHWGPKDRPRLLDPRAWSTAAFPALRGRARWMFAAPFGRDLIAGAKGEGAAVGRLRRPEDPRNLDAWSWEALSPCGWVMSIEPRDMDGDGDLDILLSDRKGALRGVRWLENPGWANRFIGGRDRETMFLAAAGDEIYCAARGAPLLRATRTGASWICSDIPLPPDTGGGKGVAVGDLDLDGAADLVVTCESAHAPKSGVIALLRRGDGWEPREVSGPEGTKFDFPRLLDLDGDGDLDVLTCEEVENLGVIWYENPARP